MLKLIAGIIAGVFLGLLLLFVAGSSQGPSTDSLTVWNMLLGFGALAQCAFAGLALRSLRHAATSADAANAAAAAANLTLQHQQETDERELRAYLDADSCTFVAWDLNEPIKINFKLFNGGSTPARDVRARYFVLYVNVGPMPDVTAEIAGRTLFDLGQLLPGRELEVHVTARESLTMEMADEVRKNRAFVLAAIEVNYRDVFGRDQHLFAVRARAGEETKTGGELSIFTGLNRAS